MIIKHGDKIDKNMRSSHESKVAGNMSLAVSLLTAFIFVMLIFMSVSDNQETVDSVVGLFALNFLLSICGMIVSAISLNRRSNCYGRTMAGLIISTLMFFVMVSVFFIGL